MNDLSVNHWHTDSFRQLVSTKEYQAILDKFGTWVFKNGDIYDIIGDKVGPSRYEICLKLRK